MRLRAIPNEQEPNMSRLFPLFLSVPMLFHDGSLFAQTGKKDTAQYKIVVLGDSITKGVRPGVKEEETFAALLEAGLKKEGIRAEVVNAGIGGETSAMALLRLREQVIDKKPKLVAIMYGTNDAFVDKGKNAARITMEEYRTNLTTMVTELRKAGIKPVLMTPTRWGNQAAPDGSGNNPNKNLEPYIKVVRDVARKSKVPLVDHYEAWSKALAEGTDIETWMTDHGHPNPKGHEEIATLMLPGMLKAIRGK
jgi:lysophospholipase L1-like esterase